MYSTCLKCNNNLTEHEKNLGLPLCQNCIGSLTDMLMEKVKRSESNRIGHDIDNFTKFILSSGKLFKLDSITIIQCCFNIFMSEVVSLKNENFILYRDIFKDAIRFIEKTLEETDKEINDSKMSNDKIDNVDDNKILSKIDKLIKNGMENGNDDTIIDIDKYIKEGIYKKEHKDENVGNMKGSMKGNKERRQEK